MLARQTWGVVGGQEHDPAMHTCPRTPTQSAVVQQADCEMQIPAHSLKPFPHEHEPALHTPPVPQSAFSQQPLPDWQEPLHTRWPYGHVHLPATQDWPGMVVQSTLAQQLVAGMQLALVTQLFWPSRQRHWRSKLEHSCPDTRQSESVQHLSFGIHELVLPQSIEPSGHRQVAWRHSWPAMVHSFESQQPPAGAQRVVPQALRPGLIG